MEKKNNSAFNENISKDRVQANLRRMSTRSRDKMMNKTEIDKNLIFKISLKIKQTECDFRDLLIEEIKKPRNDRKRVCSERDEITILCLLKKYQSFMNFLSYNRIDDMTLRNAISFMNYDHIRKGDYLFKEGDTSNRFFGVIKGRISIRQTHHKPDEEEERQKELENLEKRLSYREADDLIGGLGMKHDVKKSIKRVTKGIILTKKFYENLEQKFFDNESERFQLAEGMCFGELALIHNCRRTASAYALENTHLFYIEKDKFDLVLYRTIKNAELDRLSFVHRMLPIFKHIPRHKFEDVYYKGIEPLFYSNNQIIYEEDSKTDFIYLVYQGECALKRDISKKYEFVGEMNTNNQSENTEIEKKTIRELNHKKYHTILKLSPGDAAGLEIAAGLSKYKHSLISINNFTVLFRVNLFLLKLYSSHILDYFYPIFIEKEKLVKNFVERHQNLKKKMKINYRVFNADVKEAITNDQNEIKIFKEKKKNLIDDDFKIIEFKKTKDTFRTISVDKSPNKKPKTVLNTPVKNKEDLFLTSNKKIKFALNMNSNKSSISSLNLKKVGKSISKFTTLNTKMTKIENPLLPNKKHKRNFSDNQMQFFKPVLFKNLKTKLKKSDLIYNSGSFNLPFVSYIEKN